MKKYLYTNLNSYRFLYKNNYIYNYNKDTDTDIDTDKDTNITC
jgi:hypothetical protein